MSKTHNKSLASQSRQRLNQTASEPLAELYSSLNSGVCQTSGQKTVRVTAGMKEGGETKLTNAYFRIASTKRKRLSNELDLMIIIELGNLQKAFCAMTELQACR